MSVMLDLSQPAAPEARQACGAPPLTGELTDLQNAWRLWSEGKVLCSRCRGTGNELYSMHRACEKCGGGGEGDESDPAPWWAGKVSLPE